MGGGQRRPDLAHRAGPAARKRTLVAALRTATGAEPQVAGKPGPQLMKDAVGRGDFRAPLVIGDRLDTDIEGANTARLPSLMVLTGVNTARDAVYAVPAQRPTYIGHDLRSLHQASALLAVGPQPGWRVDVADGVITVSTSGDPEMDDLSVVRAVANAVWHADSDERLAASRGGRRRSPRRAWALVPDARRLAGD